MGTHFWKIVFWVVSGIGSLLMFAASTPMDMVSSNLSSYATYFGFEHTANILSNPQIDIWTIGVGATSLIVSVLGILYLNWTRTPSVAIKRPAQIEICFESSAPYEVVDVHGEHSLSTVRIGVRNSGDVPLSNCKVYLEKISPTLSLRGAPPILLEGGGFTIRNDDPEKLVDVAIQWSHDSKFRFHGPIGTFAESLNYIDGEASFMIVIKVTATECQRSAIFKLRADGERRLRLQFINYTS